MQHAEVLSFQISFDTIIKNNSNVSGLWSLIEKHQIHNHIIQRIEEE